MQNNKNYISVCTHSHQSSASAAADINFIPTVIWWR